VLDISKEQVWQQVKLSGMYTGHGKKLTYALFFMLFYVILYYVIFKSILEIAGKYREVEKKVKTL
jgi:hypothetical protein